MHDQISKFFPCLKELNIVDLLIDNTQNVKLLIKSNACQQKYLKQINVLCDNLKLSIEDLIEINSARSKMIESSFLTIRTNFEVIDTNLKFISIKKSSNTYCLLCQMLGPYSFPYYNNTSAYLKEFPINNL